MTYRKFAKVIMEEFNDKQKDMDLTVYDSDEDEYYSVTDVTEDVDSGVLDDKHPILVIKED